MSGRVHAFFVDRPLWLTIPVIVAISVAASVGTLFLLVELMGHGYGPTFGRSLTIAIAAPTMVSAPIGGYIVHLLRQVDDARRLAQAQAWHDPLTGMLNRRRVIELAERELALATRTGRPVAAALIDIDDFKRINDQHGHAAGDAVLQGVAKTVAEQVRGTDVLGRWGGEEFIVVLPDSDTHAALATSERIRQAVEATSVVHGAGLALRCTVSIGVSQRGPDEGLDRWLDQADRAMYRAKAAGKNQVKAADPDPAA